MEIIVPILIVSGIVSAFLLQAIGTSLESENNQNEISYDTTKTDELRRTGEESTGDNGEF